VEYISPEIAEQLISEIFSAEKPDIASCKKLFSYAKARFKTDLINRMYKEISYGPAKQYMGEYEKAQKNFAKDCRNGNLKNIQRTCNKFGIDFREDIDGRTGLMLAVLHDKTRLIDYFRQQEANIKLTDKGGRTVLHMTMLGFELEHFKIARLQKLYKTF